MVLSNYSPCICNKINRVFIATNSAIKRDFSAFFHGNSKPKPFISNYRNFVNFYGNCGAQLFKINICFSFIMLSSCARLSCKSIEEEGATENGQIKRIKNYEYPLNV